MVSGVVVATNSCLQAIKLLLDSIYGGGEVPIKLHQDDITVLCELLDASNQMQTVLVACIDTHQSTTGGSDDDVLGHESEFDQGHFHGASQGEYFVKDLRGRAENSGKARHPQPWRESTKPKPKPKPKPNTLSDSKADHRVNSHHADQIFSTAMRGAPVTVSKESRGQRIPSGLASNLMEEASKMDRLDAERTVPHRQGPRPRQSQKANTPGGNDPFPGPPKRGGTEAERQTSSGRDFKKAATSVYESHLGPYSRDPMDVLREAQKAADGLAVERERAKREAAERAARGSPRQPGDRARDEGGRAAVDEVSHVMSIPQTLTLTLTLT